MRVEYYNSSAVECDADLHYCGYEDTTPDYHCGPNIRDCYLLHYVSRGEGFYTMRGKTYPLGTGAVFCIFPKDVVYYYAKRENPWSFYWFSFNGRKALEFASRIGFSYSSPVIWTAPGNRMPELMDSLLHALGNQEKMTGFSLLGHLYGLLAELENAHPSPGVQAAPPKPASLYVDQALQYISYNYHRRIRITDISDHLGLERTYFSKLFAQVMGVPPQTYLLKFRIEKSLLLLNETALSVSEISRGVGIEDMFYFSRAFKRIVGVPPSVYREKMRS